MQGYSAKRTSVNRALRVAVLLAWVLVCLAWTCCVGVGKAYALTSQDGEWSFIQIGASHTVIITEYNGQSETVTLPPNGMDGTVTGENGEVYQVININPGVFKNNTNLKTLYLYSPITSMGNGVFEGCSNLSEIFNYDDSLVYIPDNCFKDCTSLKSIDIKGNVETIGSYAFANCRSLESITFTGDKPFTELEVRDHAFAGCLSLRSITFPPGLKTTAADTFAGCNSLYTVTYTSVPDTIDEHLFRGCTAEIMLQVLSGWTQTPAQLGAADRSRMITYEHGNDGKATIVGYVGHESIDYLNIPNMIGDYEVSTIGSHAFEGHTELKSVGFMEPSHLTTIGSYAFYNCENLGAPQFDGDEGPDIKLPSTVTSIGEYCFGDCQFLTKDPLANVTGLTVLPYECFWNCRSLKSITIPNGVTNISQMCFMHCVSLENVVLPDSVTFVGKEAFCDCWNLTNVTLPNSYHEKESERFSAVNDAFATKNGDVVGKNTKVRFSVTCGSDAWLWLGPLCSDDPNNTNAMFAADALVYVPVDLNDETVEVSLAGDGSNNEPANPVYNSLPQYPTLSAKRWHYTLTKDTDYTFDEDASSCTDAGDASAVMVGDGTRFKGSYTYEFTIDPADITGKLVMGNVGECPWDGNPWYPTSTWSYPNLAGSGSYELEEKKDFTLAYGDNVDTTKGTIAVVGIRNTKETGNFTGSQTFEFTIRKRNLGDSTGSEATIADIPDQYYTGQEITPRPKVSVPDRKTPNPDPVYLYEEDWHDIKYTYSNNVSVSDGTGDNPPTVTIVPYDDNSDVVGSKSATFKILAQDISKATIGNVEKSYVYTGSDIEPDVTVAIGTSTDFRMGRDYDVAYTSNHDVGTATITVTGKGGCFGTLETTFEITPARVTVSADSKEKTFGDDDPTLTAKVTGCAEGETVTYSLQRKKGESAGTYPITVTGEAAQGNYVVTYVSNAVLTVKPASVGLATITPIPDLVFDGSAHEPKPILTYKGVQLREGTDYALSYESNTNAGEASVKVSGKGNFDGSASQTFTIKAYNISPDDACKVAVPLQRWKGTALYPVPAYVRVPGHDGATLELVQDTDYTIGNYRDNISKGTGHFTLTGTGNYVGERDVPFEICDTSQLVLVKVNKPSDQTYTGMNIEPELGVFCQGFFQPLERDVDFKAEFSNNVNVGTAHVTITGLGDVQGTLTTEFEITRKVATITPQSASKTYGDADPAFSAVVEGIVDEFEPVYGFSREQGENVGKYPISITGEKEQGNYTFDFAAGGVLVIEPAEIGGAIVAPIPACAHTGSAVMPKPQVTWRGTELAEGTDYTLTYADNVEMGTAHVTITGMDNFTGTTTADFEITQATYQLKSGPKGAYVRRSGASFEFAFTRSDDDAITYDRFVGVEVDGKRLTPLQYFAKRGSVVITLTPAYLDLLSAGKHTLTVIFDDGSAQAEFEVVEKSAEEPKESSDTKNQTAGTKTTVARTQTEEKKTLAKTADPTFSPLTLVLLAFLALMLRKTKWVL